jgi:hypothetical protein
MVAKPLDDSKGLWVSARCLVRDPSHSSEVVVGMCGREFRPFPKQHARCGGDGSCHLDPTMAPWLWQQMQEGLPVKNDYGPSNERYPILTKPWEAPSE